MKSLDPFIGREAELKKLESHLDDVRNPRGNLGRMVSLRGRRQIGKSRLVQEFVERSGLPTIFYSAQRESPARQLELFGDAVQQSGIAESEQLSPDSFSSWDSALRAVAHAATAQKPLIIVLDEFPYLVEAYPAIESILQAVWDRVFEQTHVLLILIGSDIATMEALGDYKRPLYGRAQEMVLKPLTLANIHDMLDLEAASSLDAYCIIGGFPRLASLWHKHSSMTNFLKAALSDPESPLVVVGERSLNSEFPADIQARTVLSTIGAGSRAFSAIGQRAGIEQTSLVRALDLLQEKRVVSKQLPYSTASNPKSPRYIVSDPYLRFWLRFIGPNIDLIERGVGDVLATQIRDNWSDYRGHAVEQLVRDSVEWMLPNEQFGSAMYIGGYWTRDNRIEVDLVGGDKKGRAETINFIGSIKWRDRSPFNREDLAGLLSQRDKVPGVTDDTMLVGVSRIGFSTNELDIKLGPEDLINAWRR